MGIKPYTVNGTTLYRVHASAYPEQGGRIQRRADGIKTMKEADRVYKEMLRDATEEATKRNLQGSSWKRLILEYAEALHDGTAVDYEIQWTTAADTIRTLEIYTAPWMDRPASEVTPSDVKAAYRWMEADGKSRSRQKALKSAINGIFTWAMDNRRVKGITTSPARDVPLTVSKDEKRPEVLTQTQIDTLLQEAMDASHDWYPVWAMALLTGMRSGEMYALEWSDVCFEEKLIHVTKSYNGRIKAVKCTKGGYWRDVPISEELEAFLHELRPLTGTSKYVLPRIMHWQRGEAARVLRFFCKRSESRP